MKTKTNWPRIILFLLLVVSPVVGVFFGHSETLFAKIIDLYLVFLFLGVMRIADSVGSVGLYIFWPLYFAWVFFLAFCLEWVLRKIYLKLSIPKAEK
jgi:hypothetical protein